MRYRILFCLLPLVLSCDFGQTPASVSAESQPEAVLEDNTETEESETLIEGCEWVAGSWELTDCAEETIQLYLTDGGNCTVQVTSNHPVFTGAWGQARDAALSLFLPATGAQCQAAFDGNTLIGACGTFSGPCAIEAVPSETLD